MVEVRSAESSTLSPVESYYRTATNAIERRDYATALDYLQLARARNPRDARVWNALGVVYDKLGRFDLSAKYYAEALAIEPASSVVASNMAYSAILQARAGDQTSATVRAEAPPAPQSEPRQVVSTPPPGVAASPVASAVRKKPILLGRPLVIVNATGRPAGAAIARARLTGAGWSVDTARSRNAPTAQKTLIRFPARHRAVAEALARTLPEQAHLVACQSTCADVELFVGSDVARWTPSGAQRAAVRKS
jgi:tetratricopeptide (TPR) repeat protein